MAQEITQLTINADSSITSTKAELPPLGDDDVRIQVLFSGISKNDLLLIQGKHKNDFFGPEAIGKVTAVGKNVGHCKLGQTVGVHHENINRGQFKTGFASFLQVHQHKVIYIPDTIEPEQAACLIGTGTTAFNALEKIDAGSNIAIVGTGHLAYLTTQFAKKVFGFHTTILGYSGSEELAKEWGADAYIALSKEAITKNNEKFKAIVIADVMKEEDVFIIHEVVWRNGGVVFAIDMGFDPKMIALSMICSQIHFTGVKRGSYGQSVKALKAAAYHNVRGKVETVEATHYQTAFERSKSIDAAQAVVLKY